MSYLDKAVTFVRQGLTAKASCEGCGWSWTPNPTSHYQEYREARAAANAHNTDHHPEWAPRDHPVPAE